MIRIFINTIELEALFVPEDDLYSFRVCRDGYLEERIEQAKLYVPAGFRPIGSLRERTQVTFRYLRNGVNPTKIPLPENLQELGFDFAS